MRVHAASTQKGVNIVSLWSLDIHVNSFRSPLSAESHLSVEVGEHPSKVVPATVELLPRPKTLTP